MTWQTLGWFGMFFLGGCAFASILFVRALGRAMDVRVKLEDQLVSLREQLIEAQEDASAQYQGKKVALSRLNDALSVNEAFQRSRDEIWDLYRRSSLLAGNAQAWLSRELGKAHTVANRLLADKGKAPLGVPTGLVDLLEEHKNLTSGTEPPSGVAPSTSSKVSAGEGASDVAR